MESDYNRDIGDIGDIGDCVICSDNKISSNLHCYECNKYICIACCNKLSSRTSLLYVEQKLVEELNNKNEYIKELEERLLINT